MATKWTTLTGFAVTAVLASSNRASADSLYLGSSYQTISNITLVAYETNVQVGGGSINTSSLNGIQLPYVYCAQIEVDVSVGTTYSQTQVTNNATFNNAGSGPTRSFSTSIAGQIAWLMDNKAPTATTMDEQSGLQDVIWKTIYGSNFTLNVSGTSSGAWTAYTADLHALGSNTASISDVLWLSPSSDGQNFSQDLITSAAPEPASLTLLGIGIACMAGYSWRRRKLAVS
jgi:hypothetical protein